MALGSTQPPTGMSTKNLPGGEGQPDCKADNLTTICELIIWKMLEPRRLTTLWASMACYRDSFTFTFPNIGTFHMHYRKRNYPNKKNRTATKTNPHSLRKVA
jgi:hypothetical protein